MMREQAAPRTSDGVPAAASLATLFTSEARAALSALRRDLHQHPELAFAESRTAAVLDDASSADGRLGSDGSNGGSAGQ